jgi:hypothetical protein
MHHCETKNNPNNPAAGISGGVCVNHLWPVVAGGGGMKDEVLKLALEALETELAVDMTNGAEVGEAAELMCEAITAIKQALAAPTVQEPVGYDKTEMNGFIQDLYEKKMQKGKHGHYETMFHCVHQAIKRVTPPAAQPAVPDAIHHTDLSEHPQYIEGWNDCRAEMLRMNNG